MPHQPRNEAVEASEAAGNKPAASFKYGVYGGLISVAVWPKEVKTDSGGTTTVYSVSFERSYNEGQGWRSSNNVRTPDIPVLVHALQKAYEWVLEERKTKPVS